MEPATIGVVVTVIKAAWDILKDVRARKQAEPESSQRVLNSLDNAATETSEYLDYLRDGGKQKRSRERALSKLWRDAATDLHPFNDELASRLYLKAVSWLNPERWSSTDVNNARIKLSDIQKEIRKMSRKD